MTTPGEHPKSPMEPVDLPPVKDTPLRRLQARVDEAVQAHGPGPVSAAAVRMLTGRTTVEDVTSGLVGTLSGDGEHFSTAATGALVLTGVWHRTALAAVREATGHEDAEVRAAALTVLSVRADELRADRAVDRALVAAVHDGCGDASPEVRAAAATALGELAEGGDLALVAPTLNVLVMDVDPELANAAELALTRLADRLDHPDLRASTDF
ncbi:HEAT repeat domain-containing protein [Micrococcus sp. FDAARGOS_333]|uniref:HEAT repeat domain-containing protein n=1 Tax=Micrococcus sp. FDAARGOS_333 TaxID=1930558 RepID=UPI001D11C43A|nr:HEAT repeat domain-containing protein [Micrococcus sp. FDAARGOS_333]